MRVGLGFEGSEMMKAKKRMKVKERVETLNKLGEKSLMKKKNRTPVRNCLQYSSQKFLGWGGDWCGQSYDY